MPMPTEVTITLAIMTQIQAGSMGMKKKAMEETAQMTADQAKALYLVPTHWVKRGASPPKIMQTASPNIINTV